MFGINWWFVEDKRKWILVSIKTYYYFCCWRLIPPMHWIKTKQIYFHELIWVLCMDSAVWIQWYLLHFLTANLKQVLIFAYLKQYDWLWRLYMMIDYLRLMSQGFHVVAWTDCYPDAKELLNSAMPTYFVDADDAGWRRPEDHTTVWYCIICQQSTKLCVALKGQTTVETLTCSAIVVFWELLLRWLKV